MKCKGGLLEHDRVGLGVNLATGEEECCSVFVLGLVCRTRECYHVKVMTVDFLAKPGR